MASDSYRRINLKFDELDQDILDWLNSFGKRKRARVAKEAIRRAMMEGYPRPIISGSPTRENSLDTSTANINKPINNLSSQTDFNVGIVLCTPPEELLSLTGSEDDLSILNLINHN